MYRWIFGCIVVQALFGYAGLADAEVYLSNSGDNSTGTSWATALNSLSAAVAQADSSNTDVWIDGDTFSVGTIVSVPTGVNIYGGFPTTGDPGFGDRDSSVYVTTLDGGDTSQILKYDGSTSVVVDGIVFRNGYASGTVGGAIQVLNTSDVDIRFCKFFDNRASSQGGSIYLADSIVDIEECIFEDNEAPSRGGAISISDCTVNLSGSEFRRNESTGGGSHGGAITFSGDDVTIDNCIFENNEATYGGAVNIESGTSASVTNSLFAVNTAGQYAGAIKFVNQFAIVVANCTFVRNTVTDYAGGILFNSSVASVVNCIFMNNDDHAIYENDADADVTTVNNLFYYNLDAIYITADTVYFDEGTTSISTVASLNSTVAEASGNLAGDPAFLSYASGLYHIRSTSAAIDVGTLTNATSDDIDEESRPVDISGVGGDSTGEEYDIGYDEYLDTDGDGMPDYWEDLYGLNSSSSAGDDGAGGDADSDSLTNIEEYELYFTNPSVMDTDGDGLDDDEEVDVYLTDPNLADTDGDSVSDGDEVTNVTDPLVRAAVYVSNSGNNTTGLSWATALTSLSAAVTQAASTSKDVWIDAGTFSISTIVSVPSGVNIYGGFPATGSADFGDRDSSVYVTTLDGGDTSQILGFDGTLSVLVDGIDFRNGNGTNGAAAYVINSSIVEFSNCGFYENNHTNIRLGGGIYAADSHVDVADCVFEDNACVEEGAAIKLHQSTANVTDSVFRRNVSTTTAGAIGVYDNWITIDRCVFEDNEATSGGAVLIKQGDSASVTNSLFVGNTESTYGGGLYFDSQLSVIVSNCTFVDNMALQRGGAVYFHGGDATVVNCIFVNNDHHAIYENNNTADVTTANNLFYNNPDGIYFDEGTTTITTTATLNSTVAEASGNVTGDPVFRSAANGFYHLLSTSPAIDAGTTSYAATGDFDSESRPVDIASVGVDGDGVAYDIGFDEWLDTDGDGMPDYWEDAHGLDSNSSAGDDGASGDLDGDSLTNLEEFELYFTDPSLLDTDGDGLDDDEEVNVYLTDPTNADTDGDSVSDGDEVAAGTDPLGKAAVYVSNSGDNSTGLSWATALNSLSAAVTQATSTSKDVWIRSGTYAISTGVSVPSSVNIYGGFPGSGDPGFEDRDTDLYPSVLDAEGVASSILEYSGSTTVKVDGLRFINIDGDEGGAIRVTSTSVVSILDCEFFDNHADTHGSGIFVDDSEAFITDCVFEDNDALEGGAVVVISSKATINSSEFRRNVVDDEGGAIRCYNVQVWIDRCVFEDNIGAEGGAVHIDQGISAEITNSLFRSNTASTHGGGLALEAQDEIVVANCTFVDNTAVGNAGGGLLLRFAEGSVVNNIFVNNSNYAVTEKDDRADLSVLNNLFYSNPDGTYYDEWTTGIATAEGGGGLNSTVAEASGNVDGDPDFLNPNGGDYHIRLASGSIDIGTATDAPTSDIDGDARPIDIPSVGANGAGVAYDIGYDEYLDADGDGLPDYWETEFGLDPDSSAGDDGASGDGDGDSLTNLEEYGTYFTNPSLEDSDGDGYTDAEEVALGLDPNVSDVYVPVRWVNYSWLGSALGTFVNPFKLFSDAQNGISDGNIIYINGGAAQTSSSWVGTLNSEMVIKSYGGSVTIGE